MRLLVCGGRDFRDYDLLASTLDAAVQYAGCTEIICGYDPDDGRYQGADELAHRWALENEHRCRTFPADWDRLGRRAGPVRNSQMAAEKPDECVAFPRANGQWGPGTLDMIGKAARAGATVHRVSPPPSARAPEAASDRPQEEPLPTLPVDKEGR